LPDSILTQLHTLTGCFHTAVSLSITLAKFAGHSLNDGCF